MLISTGTGSTAWSQNVNALGLTECNELNVALGQHGYQPVKYPNQISNTMRQNRSVEPDSDFLVVTSESLFQLDFSFRSNTLVTR